MQAISRHGDGRPTTHGTATLRGGPRPARRCEDPAVQGGLCPGAEAEHTSTVSSESRPKSLMKCEVGVTLAGSTFWKFLTTSSTRADTSSFGRNPPLANERDHSAGATRRGAADAEARGAMRTAALTKERAPLRSADSDDMLH
jgi:hypothetical protein